MFSSIFVIFLFKIMIPKTPQYDNCNPEFKIKNGLYIKIANNDIDIDV